MQTERAPARGIQGTQQEIMIFKVDQRFLYSIQRGRAGLYWLRFVIRACPLPNLLDSDEVLKLPLAPFPTRSS